MLSNKLTFSLVLVCAFALAFAAIPAAAQTAVNVGAVAKDGFAVVARSADGASAGIVDGGTDPAANAVIVADDNVDMPNLEEFLRFGGTIELQRQAAGADAAAQETAAAAAAKGASAGATDDEKKASLWRKAVISEIMWGLDTPSDDTDGRQWIEVHSLEAAVTDAAAAVCW